VDGDLGRQIVWQIVQLPAATDRHQDVVGPLFNGNFHDGDGVEDCFDGTAQIQTSSYSETALDALLEE